MTKNIHHKRTLYFKNFENNDEGNIWSLFWYGRIFFKPNESRFYIEAYLALMKNDNYFLDSINKNRIEKVEIPFTKSILFPLSTQFDYEGKFIRMSNLYNDNGDLKKGLYKFGRFRIYNPYNLKSKKLDDIFSNTLFPNVYENENSIYENSFYFLRKIAYDNVTSEYIIPVDVILKYFLGFSSLIFDLLITNRLRYAFLKKSYDPKTRKGKLFYDSDIIPRPDATLIAKYFFTKNNYAENLFYRIGAYFSTLRLNNIKNGSFIRFEIPFDFPCEFTCVGQYITKNNSDTNVKKIIINQILEISGDEDFFLVDDDFDLIDINDSENQKDEENVTNVKDVRISGDVKPTNGNTNVNGDSPLDINNNDRVINNPVVLRNCFTTSPEVKHLVERKDKDGNPIYLADERPNDHQDFSNYYGPKNRDINNYTHLSWIEIIEEATEYLTNNYHYKVKRLSDKISEKLTKKIIFELSYEGVNYYILDSGGNNYFPLFRNKNRNESIDIDVIYEMIEIIKREYKSGWSIVSSKKSLKNINKFSRISFLEKQDILFLRNNTHQLIGEEGVDDIRAKTVENLANKIHKKILVDIQELSEN